MYIVSDGKHEPEVCETYAEALEKYEEMCRSEEFVEITFDGLSLARSW